jgi:uncharacterized membrane protein YiaA
MNDMIDHILHLLDLFFLDGEKSLFLFGLYNEELLIRCADYYKCAILVPSITFAALPVLQSENEEKIRLCQTIRSYKDPNQVSILITTSIIRCYFL